jgi:hypothetical protein
MCLLQARTLVSDFGRAQEKARQAIQLASQWPDSWVSKGIRVHAHGWFFYDPNAAMEVFGGLEEAKRQIKAGGLIIHFMTAVGSLCGQRYDQVLSSLQAAAVEEPGNPFIDFLSAVALMETGSPEAAAALSQFATEHANHPLALVLGSSPSQGGPELRAARDWSGM